MKRVLFVLTVVVMGWPLAAGATVVLTPDQESSQRAVELLDPSWTSAAANRAFQLLLHGKPAKAMAEAQWIIAHNPSQVAAYEILAAAALVQHQPDQAKRALTKALQLNPQRAVAMVLFGDVENDTGHPQQAESWFSKAIERSPALGVAYRGRALARLQLGRLPDAAADAQESLKRSEGRDAFSKHVLAQIDYELGRPAEAEALLADVLQATPNAQGSVLLQGLVKLELNKLDEATALFNRVIQHDPQSALARLGLGVVQRLEDRLPEAQGIFEQLTREQPTWWVPFFQLAETYLAQGEEAAAMRAAAAGIRASQQPARLQLRAGQLFLRYGAPAQALELLQAAASSNPSDINAQMALGRFYAQRGRAKDALARFQSAAAASPESPWPLAAQANAYAALGDAQAARQAAQHAVHLQGDTPTAWLLLATVSERLGKMREAEDTYQRILARDPDALAAHRGLAMLEAKSGRMNEAIHRLEKTAASHPDDLSLAMDLASLYEQAGQADRAQAAYRRVIQRDARQPVALNNLAFLLSTQTPHLEEAFTLAQRTYHISPGSSKIADTFGWICALRGELRQAEELLAKAARLDPDDPQIGYHLGLTYLKLGNTPHARTELQRALQSGAFPEADDARTVLQRL